MSCSTVCRLVRTFSAAVMSVTCALTSVYQHAKRHCVVDRITSVKNVMSDIFFTTKGLEIHVPGPKAGSVTSILKEQWG